MSIMTVERHEVDDAHAARQIEALSAAVPRFLDLVPENPAALSSVWSWAHMIFGYRCVVDPTAADEATWAALRLVADAGEAILTGATGTGVVATRVGDREVRFTAPGDGPHAGVWLHTVWLAVVARDEDRVARLCAVSEERLRTWSTESSAYLYPWTRSVRTYLRGEYVTPGMFTPAMDGTDPDQAPDVPEDAMLMLNYPPVEVSSPYLPENLLRGVRPLPAP